MRKTNILIACDNSLRELGEMLCDMFLERKEKEVNEVFYCTGDDANMQRLAETMLRQENFDIFVNLNGFIDLSRIRSINPCRHIFTIGFFATDESELDKAFEEGFRYMRMLRHNILVVKNVSGEERDFLLIYPEKTADRFQKEDSAMENLADNAIRRENVAHIKSIEEEDRVLIPDEVFKKFHRLGKTLFNKGLLPVVEGGTYGNFSMMDNGNMYITGRGSDKGDLPRDHIVRINSVEKIELTDDAGLAHLPKVFARIFYSGKVKPSIDSAINHALLERTGFKATVHIHTDKIFADLPMTGYNYPCGAKEELDEIMKLVRKYPNADIIQQYKHGLVVMGRDFDDCLKKIENLFSHGISARKIKEDEKKDKEFLEWEEHYKKNTKGKNADIDIYDTRNLNVIQKGETKMGFLYTRTKDDTTYFVFYSLEEFTRKKLGLGEKVINIVSKIARSEQCPKIGILTTRECNVIPYYEKRGFRISSEDPGGSVWMEKEV